MTSNCSFRKLLALNLKRRIWLMLLSGYLYLTYILDYILAQSGQALFLGDDRLGPGNKTVLVITVFLGIVSAFQGFGFLFSEDNKDFYFGLPVKRSRLFFTIYLNGLLISIIPCILSRLLCYFVEGSRSHAALSAVWMGILINTAGFLLIYHIVLCVIFLTGHMLIAMIGTFAAFFYGSLTFGFLIKLYSNAFFSTYYKVDFMNALTVYFSPYVLYCKLGGTDQPEEIGQFSALPYLPQLLVVFLIAAVIFLFIYLLFQKRPAESAGRSLAFDKSQVMIKCMIAVPLILTVGYYVMLCSLSGRSLLLLLFGLLFAAFTLNGILEVVFLFDIRAFFSHWKQAVFLCLFCILTAGSFYFDLWNYDGFTPDSAEVDSAAIAVCGLDETFDATVLDKPQMISFNDSQLNTMVLKSNTKDLLLRWITDIRSETAEDKPITYVAVSYRLSKGGTIYRKYPIYYADQLNTFSSIYESAGYKEGAFPILNTEGTGTRNFVWSNGIQTYTLNLSEEENAQLLAHLTDNIKQMSLTDLTTESPVGTLALAYAGAVSEDEYLIYPSFQTTLEYLESLGIPAQNTLRDYEVTQIQIFEKQTETNLFGKVNFSRTLILDTKDIEEIQEIIPDLLPETYAMNQILNPTAAQYQAIISVKDSAGKTIRFVTMSLKNGEIVDTL